MSLSSLTHSHSLILTHSRTLSQCEGLSLSRFSLGSSSSFRSSTRTCSGVSSGNGCQYCEVRRLEHVCKPDSARMVKCASIHVQYINSRNMHAHTLNTQHAHAHSHSLPAGGTTVPSSRRGVGASDPSIQSPKTAPAHMHLTVIFFGYARVNNACMHKMMRQFLEKTVFDVFQILCAECIPGHSVVCFCYERLCMFDHAPSDIQCIAFPKSKSKPS